VAIDRGTFGQSMANNPENLYNLFRSRYPNTNITLNGKVIQTMASGGSFITDGPTPIVAGEGNEPEYVSVTPLSKMGSCWRDNDYR